MALYTVGNLKDAIAGKLTGTTLNNVTDANGTLQRAVSNMIQRAYIPEAIGQMVLTLYDKVFDYAVDQDTFGAQFLDLRPQGSSRSAFDFVYKQPNEQWDRTKNILPNGYKITPTYRNGVPYLRIASPKPFPRALLDPMSSTTGWTAGGNASALAKDQTFYYESPASLRFTLAAAGTLGYLERTLASSFDLTSYLGVGVVFIAFETQDPTAISSLSIRLGSSSSAYYTVTKTTPILGSFVLGQWCVVALDLSLATTVGSPTITAMNYLRVIVNYVSATALSNVRLGGAWIALPSPHELIFQTAKIFIPNTAGAVPQKTITDDNDTIILSDPAYNLLVHEGAREIVLGMGGSAASPIVQTIDNDLWDERRGLYPHYRGQNPSQAIEMIGNYYDDEGTQ